MRTIPKAVQNDARRIRETIVQMGRRRSLRDPIFSTCEALNLTPPQFHTLMWLGADGPLPMGELSRRLGISEKTMTGVVDRLEKAGQAQRVRGDKDRRVIRVRLSRKGAATYRKLDEQIHLKLSSILFLLDAEDRGDLLRIFDKLRLRFEQLLQASDDTEAA